MIETSTHPLPTATHNIDDKKLPIVTSTPIVDSEDPNPEDALIPILEPYETTPVPSLSATQIISSPYPHQANQLTLSHLDTQSQLFALALTQMLPIRPDYATAPYLDSFNWSDVFALLRSLTAQQGLPEWKQQTFYLVIFRSQLQAGADRDRLGLLDRKSHEEACASGGLLRYWFGRPNEERRNLATCIWRNREDAFLGGKGPWHRRARGAAREMYDSITFHTHRFTVEDGATAWKVEEYSE